MPSFEKRSPMPVTQAELFAWHERPGAFERLSPSWEDVRVISRSGGIRDGGRVVISVPTGGLRRTWEAEHFGYRPPEEFRDRQVRGPFRSWVHTHRCEAAGESSALVDHVDYELPLGKLGSLLGGGLVERKLKRSFGFRHQRTANDLGRHRKWPGRLRIGVTGASGVLGRQLVPFLTGGGHEVRVFVRREPRGPEERFWDPAAGKLDPQDLEGIDAVVHLSGENITDVRWTAERKRRFVSSRLESTRLIAGTLAAMKQGPRVFVSASAIGFYGDRGGETLTEESSRGRGYLADLCSAWEDSARPALEAGLRVVLLRIGVVLSGRGGALGKLVRPARFGMSRIGSGRQFVSWISPDDLVYAIHECLMNERLAGPVNATAPVPVTNAELLRAVGGRDGWWPMPEWAVKAALRERGAVLLLEGARIVPSKLLAAGFEFTHPDIERAVDWELGR